MQKIKKAGGRLWGGLMEHETLLNAGQVAEMLGLSVATIRKWVLIRYIPYQKIGRAVRFSAVEIRKWVKGRTVAPKDNPQSLPAEQPVLLTEITDNTFEGEKYDENNK